QAVAGPQCEPQARRACDRGPAGRGESMKEVRIGLLGLGTVGGGVIKILESRRAMLEERAGCRLTLAAVADTDLTRPREGLDLTTLAFEAAVAGGIPLIQAVKEGLVANRILSVFGIVNGTSNYILSKMTDEALDFSLVLKEAQAHGYAEADPTLDIEGMDSAHKLQ